MRSLSKTTLPEIYWPLMDGKTIKTDHCVVCGASYSARPLNQHHVCWRSWGQLFKDGRKVENPTVTLCGNGNCDGCHGLAHRRQLHFRWRNHWEVLITDEPMKYDKALEMEGWRPLYEQGI